MRECALSALCYEFKMSCHWTWHVNLLMHLYRIIQGNDLDKISNFVNSGFAMNCKGLSAYYFGYGAFGKEVNVN